MSTPEAKSKTVEEINAGLAENSVLADQYDFDHEAFKLSAAHFFDSMRYVPTEQRREASAVLGEMLSLTLQLAIALEVEAGIKVLAFPPVPMNRRERRLQRIRGNRWKP